MSETGSAEVEINQETTVLPDISNHRKLVEIAGKTIFTGKHWKEKLDTVYEWWFNVNEGKEKGTYQELVEATGLTIPDLEKDDAKGLLEERQKDWININQKVRSLATGEVSKWKAVKETAGDIDEYREGEDILAQAAILLKAMDKHHDQDPLVARRLIVARRSKLWNTAGERIQEYGNANPFTRDLTGVKSFSTRGEPIMESYQIDGALNGQVWSDEELEKQDITYQNWRKGIEERFPDYIKDNLKILWDAVRGTNNDQV
jgi:hypothetical protein